MLKIWGRKTSSNVQTVMWCVGEMGLAYERIDAGFSYGVVDTPQYRAMNPMGRVPTIQDGDNPPLWESGAILRYLANTYGEESLWPSDPVARPGVDMWAEWAKINFATGFSVPVFWPVVRIAPSKRDPAIIQAGLDKLNPLLDIAEAELSKSTYLAGDDLTLADIQFATNLYRYFDIEIERADHPNVRRYYDRLTGRPAFQEHVMVSYDELRVTD